MTKVKVRRVKVLTEAEFVQLVAKRAKVTPAEVRAVLKALGSLAPQHAETDLLQGITFRRLLPEGDPLVPPKPARKMYRLFNSGPEGDVLVPQKPTPKPKPGTPRQRQRTSDEDE